MRVGERECIRAHGAIIALSGVDARVNNDTLIKITMQQCWLVALRDNEIYGILSPRQISSQPLTDLLFSSLVIPALWKKRHTQ
jgi:hypothetical protein